MAVSQTPPPIRLSRRMATVQWTGMETERREPGLLCWVTCRSWPLRKGQVSGEPDPEKLECMFAEGFGAAVDWLTANEVSHRLKVSMSLRSERRAGPSPEPGAYSPGTRIHAARGVTTSPSPTQSDRR